MFTLTDSRLIERKCINCKFCVKERPDPKVLQDALFCKYGPPAVILVPTARNAATTQRTFPVMLPDDWCHRFEGNATSLAPVGE